MEGCSSRNYEIYGSDSNPQPMEELRRVKGSGSHITPLNSPTMTSRSHLDFTQTHLLKTLVKQRTSYEEWTIENGLWMKNNSPVN